MNRKKDFPIFRQYPKLNYLDTAATSQKPKQVIDTVAKFYREQNANIHRGIYELSEVSTKEYERARSVVARFIGARMEDIIFVRNATEGINLIAYSYGSTLKKGDTVLISIMEHHANFVPWLELKRRKGIRLEIVNIHENGTLDMQDFTKKLKQKPKLVAMTYVSNAIGTVNPVKKIVEQSKSIGAKVLIDACQAVQHMKVDISRIGCDFLVFSGHKMYGPTGIGVLYMKKEIADTLPPFITGGDMISQVTSMSATYLPSPQRFEAGTPNLSGAVGLAAAVRYLELLGIQNIAAHEQLLLKTAWSELKKIKGIRLLGPERMSEHAPVISFALDGIHPHDIAQIFDSEGIAIRAGNHCAQPLMKRLGLESTARLSFGIYNEEKDIARVLKAIHTAKKIFSLP